MLVPYSLQLEGLFRIYDATSSAEKKEMVRREILAIFSKVEKELESIAPVESNQEPESETVETSTENPLAEAEFEIAEDVKQAVTDSPVDASNNDVADDTEIAEATEFEEIRDSSDTYSAETIEEKSTIGESSNQILDINESLFRKSHGSDLKTSFTINDRFRFCRELFGNSKSAMDQAIEQIEAFAEYEDAFDYITHTLNLNADDSTVADFIRIIAAYFNA